MYSPRRTSYNSPPPELSNNPFIDHPANALNRFPDINGTDQPSGGSQFTSWLGGGSSVNSQPTGYAGAQPSGFTGGYAQQQQPQQTGYPTSPVGGYPQQGGFGGGYAASPVQAQPTGRPFQPASSFGQQLASQINGGYGAQPQQQPQQQQQQYAGYQATPQYGAAYGYPQQQQQQPQQTQYLAEFDPYASQQQQQQTPAAQGQPPSSFQGNYKTPHPRDYVRSNKQELESWDSYAWKQVMNCFDGLKDAWATRKREIEARMNALSGQGLFGGGGYSGGYGYNQYGQYQQQQQQQYGQAQEYQRLEQLAKEADSNVDTVVAASFQMQEAHGGYRQSGDLASKKRVREAINAALGNLPDWPPQNY
ncbi:hypothetical protein PsYK624_048330 [Phanerochaete sordida]|uniref:Uncharacterized protein n=1 Tax=Phanerochaete sordida TaxID=48140 RepID=A0A9P3LB13_9APHY|nr:hypothetical protein PsYK624_048330 [Phanerochaete sordida]